MIKIKYLTLFTTLILSNLSIAGDERYQVVILQQRGGGGETTNHSKSKVFILDSKFGDMWTWEDRSKFTTNDGKMAFGTRITYQGKLKPGKEIGEIVDFEKTIR